MIRSNRGTARIGLLVPFTNCNLEADMALMAPHGVTIHSARLGGYEIDQTPGSDQMAGLGAADIAEPLRLLAGVRPDVILYGCTSATLAHGVGFDRDLAARASRLTGATVVTAAGALVSALRRVGARRVAFASPYLPELNDKAVAFLAAAGIEAVSRADYPEDLGNYGQGALTPAEVMTLARRADSSHAEALVLSCTDMRAVETIVALERDLGKPVITSNQALMYAAMAVMGLDHPAIPLGRLFQAELARMR